MNRTEVLRIEALSAGGRGVGRVDKLVWMVSGGVPGDRVRARPLRRRARLVEAVAVEILEPSSLRRIPPCVYQGVCGGCPWMVLAEDEQLRWKRRLLQDALERIGKLEHTEVEEPRPSPRPLGYRNRVELQFGRDERGEPVLGMHRAGDPRALVDVDRCLLQGETAAAALTASREFFLSGRHQIEASVWDAPQPLRLAIRHSRYSGRLLVALLGGPRSLPSARAYAHWLLSCVPAVEGIVRLHGSGTGRGGMRTETLAGRSRLDERLGGTVFRTPAVAFTQVNVEAADTVVDLVREMAEVHPGHRALDLYSGVGAVGAALAREGAHVLAVEADAAAVNSGREVARRLELDLHFAQGDVARVLGSPRVVRCRWGRVVANPPRAGLAPAVGGRIADLGAGRVVVVSCDPATLARDLARMRALGYTVRRVVPVDLFPQTAHVESVTLLEAG